MSANSESKSKKSEPLTKPKEEILEGKPIDAEYTARKEENETTDQNFEQEVLRLTMLHKEQNDKYLRLLAEYDNFRKRSQKEREMIFPEAFATCASMFLPVLDNLERAVCEETTDLNYKKGVEMIKKQFNDSLSKAGITEMRAQGAKFNPELHNAVMHVEDKNFGENVVAEVMQKGYIMGDKVVRHAIVKVAN